MMTLSDQLAVPDSPDLRDLLKSHNSQRRRRRRARGETHTLASAIAAEKRDESAGSGERHPAPDGGDIPGVTTTTLETILSAPEPPVSREQQQQHTERVSLMVLLEQTEWHGSEEEEEVAWRCCVCMVRRKGAAFIPCGHTFCRACSTKLLARRRSCPLCNDTIQDVLHIY